MDSRLLRFRFVFFFILLAGVFVLGNPSTRAQAPAQPQAPGQPQAQPRPADQAAINAAIQRGVQFLRFTQNQNGGWGKGTKPGGGEWLVGYTSLAGITLIECGVATSDPSVQAAASVVRTFVNELDMTYEVALAILFLDRLGEKSDRSRIQTLAGRLIMGQSSTGGWGYKVPNKQRADIDVLLAAIRRLSPPQPYTGPSFRARPGSLGLCIKSSDDTYPRPLPPPFDFEKVKQTVMTALPISMKRMPLFLDISQLQLYDPKDKGHDPVTPTTDNSNTHFAMLGLWAARKYDVPADRSFALLINRFRTSQAPDGMWAYPYAQDGGGGGSSAMTAVALLGLAIGHVLNPDPSVPPEKDPRVINAFNALSKRIGEPAGRIDGRPLPNQVGGLYFLWGMERIAVLYDVRQLDKKDWYQWGAEILVGSQQADGSWLKGGYPGDDNAIASVSNTCFACLFLKRANLTPDLSRRLTVDTSALTQSLTKPSTPPPEPSPKTPEPTPVVTEQPPPKKVESKPNVESTPVVESKPVSTPPPPEPKSKLPWIIGLIVLGIVGGGCILLAILKRKKSNDDDDDEDEDDDRPKKKRKKASAKGENGKEKPRGKAKSATKRVVAEEEDD